MKIAKIDTVNGKVSNIKIASNQSKPQTISNNKSTNYNPIYYKPQILFKGGFESYFPTQILGYDEQSFNDMLLKAIQDPKKKQRIINCITNAAEKDHKTMEFVGMWQKAVPSIVSQNLFSNLSGQGVEELAHRFGTQGIINSATSPVKKFLESDYQTDIIRKEAKSVTAGVISSKLFLMATADPEPVTKVGLYAASIVVGGVGYVMRGSDSKKIQDKQFVDATKELIKFGVVDPHDLINSANDYSVRLSDEKLKTYHNWKNKRVLDLRYYKTGSYKDLHNDFATTEGKNVLNKSIQALKHMGFGDEKISKYLNIMGLVYFSGKETQEAQFLLETSLNAQKQLYGKNSIKLIDTLKILARVQDENEEPINAKNTLKEILSITEISSPNDINAIKSAKKNLLMADLKLALNLYEKEKTLQRDYDISITPARYKKIRDELIPLVQENKQEAIKESESLIEQIGSLDLNKNEYVQLFELSSKYEENPQLKTVGQKLINTVKSHSLVREIGFDDMTPELYAKFTQKLGTSDNTLMLIDDKFGDNSLYKARFLESVASNKYSPETLQTALSIYQKNLGEDSLDTIRCQINTAIQMNNRNELIKLENTLLQLSKMQQELIKPEISQLYFHLGSKIETNSAIEILKNSEYFSKALRYNPSLAESILEKQKEINSNYHEHLFSIKSSSLENLHEKIAISMLETFINPFRKLGKNLEKASAFINISGEELIKNFLKHINEGADPFGLNQRFLLKKQKSTTNRLILEKNAIEKINIIIRKIEANLKLMKIK